MENTKMSSALLEYVVAETGEGELRELNDLQLAVVGGGTAEVTLI